MQVNCAPTTATVGAPTMQMKANLDQLAQAARDVLYDRMRLADALRFESAGATWPDSLALF